VRRLSALAPAPQPPHAQTGEIAPPESADPEASSVGEVVEAPTQKSGEKACIGSLPQEGHGVDHDRGGDGAAQQPDAAEAEAEGGERPPVAQEKCRLLANGPPGALGGELEGESTAVA
jgi:hypothetical protein